MEGNGGNQRGWGAGLQRHARTHIPGLLGNFIGLYSREGGEDALGARGVPGAAVQGRSTARPGQLSDGASVGDTRRGEALAQGPAAPRTAAPPLTLAGLGGYLALRASSFSRGLTRQERRWEKVSKLFLPW